MLRQNVLFGIRVSTKPVKRKKIINESTVTHVNSEAARRIKDKFRSDIAGVIVQHLGPYRKDSCQVGRITNNDDFKHLAKKVFCYRLVVGVGVHSFNLFYFISSRILLCSKN